MTYQELDKLDNIVEFNENLQKYFCFSWKEIDNKLIINYNKNNDTDEKYLKRIKRRIKKFNQTNFYKKTSEKYIVVYGKKIFYKYISELKLISFSNYFDEIIICKNQKQVQKRINIFLSEKLIQLVSEIISNFNDKNLSEYNLVVKNNIKSFYGKINYLDKKLIFNLILIHYPIQVIKSVIFHEISHFYTKGHKHDKFFYAKLYELFPEYNKYNTELNQNKFI